MKIIKIASFVLIVILVSSTQAFAGKGKEYDETRKIGKINCVYDSTAMKWKYAKKNKNGTYNLKKKPKKTSKNFKKKNKKFKQASKKCKNQSDPNAATFANIPGAHQIIPQSTGTSAVSGTPPAYTAITDSSALTTYWREVDDANVIAGLNSGSPTANQCDEFFGGDADGESGGLNACEANLDALRALVKPLEGGIAACYLQNVTSEDNLAAGGISLDEDSSFPGDNVQNLYAAPAGSNDRVVKMQVINAGGENPGNDIYVKVHAQDNNAAANLMYKVDLWFCNQGQTSGTPYGLDHIQVGTDNSYLATSLNTRDGSVYRSLAGSVTSEGGEYNFDPSQPTESSVIFIAPEDGGSFGYQITTLGGFITMKSHSVKGTERDRSMTKIGYLGGVSDLMMTQGALNSQHLTNNIVTETNASAFEYRDTFYASAPDSSLLTDVQAADFAGESFFNDTPSTSDDFTGFECGAETDVDVVIDMSTDTMKAIQNTCSSFVPKGTDFCDSSEIDDAEDSYETNCSS